MAGDVARQKSDWIMASSEVSFFFIVDMSLHTV